MMRRFPPVTVERLLRWTAACEVPGESLVYDDEGRMVTSMRYDQPARRLWLESAYAGRASSRGRVPFTLKLLLQTAEELGAAGDVQFWHDGGRIFNDVPVIDLGDGEVDGCDVRDGFPAGHYLYLQRRWG